MMAQHGFIPPLQMLLKNPLFLIGAQQTDILIAAVDKHLRQLEHRRYVINANIHVDRIGAHCAHLHHRNRGVLQPVAYGIAVFNAKQNGGGDVRGQQRFQQLFFLLQTVLRFCQHDLIPCRL